jgi:hypothetical protein
MSLAPAYIVATGDQRDPHEFVPEESHRARAIPVYAALRSLGRRGSLKSSSAIAAKRAGSPMA